jgi:hypothetical protein
MSKSRNLANLLSGGVPAFGGTDALDVPAGTQAQRPSNSNTGYVRFNTDQDNLEQYTSEGWKGISAPPQISEVSPTTFDGTSGTSFTVTGSGFKAGSTASFVTNGGTEVTAGSVTINSASEMVITTPQDFLVSDEPLKVKVTSPTGLSAVTTGLIDCGGVPTWSTGASLPTVYKGTSYSQTFSATDPEGSAVSYSLASGSLPTGTTLNSSTGVVSGTLSGISGEPTFNFTLAAEDTVGNTTQRAFSQPTQGDALFVPSGLTPIVSIETTASGFNNTGTSSVSQTGTPTFPAGGVYDSTHYATDFIYNVRYLQINSMSTLANANYTFMAWYKGTQTIGYGHSWSPTIPIFGDTRGSVYAGGGLESGYATISYSGANNGTTFVADGNWHHLCWRWRSNRYIDLFVDGNLERSVDANSYKASIYMDYIANGYAYSGCTAPTALVGIQVYSGSLSDAQIAQIANGG